MRALSRDEPLQMFGKLQDNRIESVYVINLDRQPSRWKTFIREARRQHTEDGDSLLKFCQRVSAVDGKLLEERAAIGLIAPTYPLDAQYFADPDPRLLPLLCERSVQIPMSPEEVAVALSHVKTWHRIVEDKRMYALVFEDDVFFEPGFAAQLNRSWRELSQRPDGSPQFDLLYVSFREVERGSHTLSYSPNLLTPIRGYWWLSGYILSYAGAKKLLDSLPVVGPVDLWMNHLYASLDVYSTPRPIVSQRTDFVSDNRYSILPFLSQLGVQSDKTHVILEQTKGRRPVFCFGFNRETATILDTALSLLGYRCCNDQWGLFSANIGHMLEGALPLLFDAYIHVSSVSRAFRQITDLYPDALFILPPTPQDGSELSADVYREVMAHLLRKTDQTLITDIGSLGWHALCTFLGCHRPSYPFPTNILTRSIPAPCSRRTRRIPVEARKFLVPQHDVHPWIVPYERLSAFGVLGDKRAIGTQTGAFTSIVNDTFVSLDESRWMVLEDSFPSNLARFRRDNVKCLPSGGCRMTISENNHGDHQYAAASFASTQPLSFGRFEVTLRPAGVPGVVTAFFLHRNDPWQEIDVELLGQDPTKLLTNVYFNPGDPGTTCNFGNRGTPVVVDLPFNAADNYHRYAIEWEPHEIRWFVDDELLHVRGLWEPTPIPLLPMQLYCSVWPPRSVELAGTLRSGDLPVSSFVKSITISDWCATTHQSPTAAFGTGHNEPTPAMSQNAEID